MSNPLGPCLYCDSFLAVSRVQAHTRFIFLTYSPILSACVRVYHSFHGHSSPVILYTLYL